MNNSMLKLTIAGALAAMTTAASASCGSAFCTLMTDRYAQGTGEAHLGWSVDLRIESVSQSRLLSGTSSINASQVTGEDAIERHTRNLNVVTTLGYGFDENWSVSVRIPVVKRDHLHDLIDDTTGLPSTSEQWRFTKLGDVQVLARRQALSDDVKTAFAWFGGLKLPTGSTKVVNADGSRAERALQPGTGTTDAVIGIAGRRAVGMNDALIGQVSVSAALNKQEEFRPGTRVEASVGWSHAYSQGLGAVLQLNVRHRGHDSGDQAEPGNSGSTTIDLSPGVTFGLGQSSTLYGYVQLPLYQKVTGIQLVPRTSIAVGWTRDF
ncbi:MAG: hypothetical protein JF606_16120 [Burkholderiales bacterium]|nr:hypothetical protein [Burkholderiales bacterium]